VLWLGLEGRKKLADLQNRMETLEDERARFERNAKGLELDFVDLLDKVEHFMGRQRSRSRRGQEELHVEYDDLGPEYSHLDEVSKQIVRQRKGTLSWRNGGKK
jgi:chromosome segregation ATPase